MSSTALWLCAVLVIGSAAAADVPFVFGEGSIGIAGYNSAQIEKASSSSPDLAGVPAVSMQPDNATLNFPVVGGGNNSGGTSEKKVGDLKRTLNSRVEPDNPLVHSEALVLAGKHPGDHTIEQICAIYSFLKNGDSSTNKWSYVDDPRGIDYFNYANSTLILGKSIGCAGIGDCDDFAILMSALVESIGGVTRIILAHNNTTGGHAYTEVYLGQDNAQNSQVNDVINWLKQNYDTNKIYTHIDTDTKDVWLNLDWWADHPGGPFYQGDKHIPLRIRDNYSSFPLTLPEKPNKPPRLINLSQDRTSPQEAGTTVVWTAKAKDADNDSIFYRFFLNDDPVTQWTRKNQWIWNVTDDDIGDNRIEVRVRDGKHASPDVFDSRRIANITVIAPIKKTIHSENQTPVIYSLTSDRSSPADAGTSITWTAVAKDAENDPIIYRFLLNDDPVTQWVKENQWVWNTTDDDLGHNQIEVHVRDKMHNDQDSFDNNKTASFTIIKPRPVPQVLLNQTPAIESLTLDKSSPQDAGASITWTALAYDPENDQIFYRFLLNGRPVTDWTSENAWHWHSSEKDAGKNRIEVQVRDGKHAGPKACDDSAAADFEIKIPNQQPNLVSLIPDQLSPQDAGMVIVWTALASDPDGDPILYRFLLNGKPVTDWDIENKWTWTTTENDEGENRLEVGVRDGKHAGLDGFDDKMSASFMINKARDAVSSFKPSYFPPATSSYKPSYTPPAASSHKPSYVPASRAYPIGG